MIPTRTIRSVALAAVALAAVLGASAAPRLAVALEIPGDPGGTWMLAQSTANEKVALREWLRPGATFTDWREMLSALEVRQISSPLELSEDTRQRIRRQCPGATWRYVRQLPDDVLYVSDSGRCADGSGPEIEVARLTPMPGTRTYKVSWSHRGNASAGRIDFWIGALDGALGSHAGRAHLDTEAGAGPRPAVGDTRADDLAASGRRDTDAELERCKAAPDPFGCIARIQERLLTEGRAAAEANARSSADVRTVGRGTANTDAEIERCKSGPDPIACLNRLQERLLAEGGGGMESGRPTMPDGRYAPGIASVRTHDAKPDGGPAGPNQRFKTTATQIYAVVMLDGNQAGRELEFDWRYLSDPAGERTLSRRATRIEGHEGRIWSALTSMQLMPEGEYRVDVYLDGRLAGQAHFTVVRAGTFG